MKRTQLGTAIGATAASVALGMALAGPAAAVSPDPAPFCAAGGFVLSDAPGAAITDDNTVTRTVNVSGQTGTVRDVDVLTNIFHTHNGDLQIELTHGGKTVRFITAKATGRAGKFGFNGTLWDDSALAIVANTNWAVDGVKTQMTPEGALSSFIGADPNGAWTLTVRDFASGVDLNGQPFLPGETGTLNSWTLNVKTSNQASATTTANFASTAGAALIPDGPGGVVTQTVQVSGANPYLTDLNLRTQINHEDNLDLEVKLTSPAGTTVTISQNRASGSQAALTTTWDDSSQVLIATHPDFMGGTTEPNMVPDGALGAFIGENPNGTWTLTIADVLPPGSVGSLVGWSLDVTSTGGCPPPPPGTGPGVVGLPRGPVCRKVNLVTTILGAKRGERGDVARIKVKVANKTRNARARAAKAVFKLPAGFTLAGKQQGITVKKGKVTATFGVIAGGKAKTKTIKLKAKANAAFGRKVSSVAVTALCGSKAKGATIKLIVARG